MRGASPVCNRLSRISLPVECVTLAERDEPVSECCAQSAGGSIPKSRSCTIAVALNICKHDPAVSAGGAAESEMPDWMRDHTAVRAAEQRRDAARARARRLQAAQAKLAAAKQRRQQVRRPSGMVAQRPLCAIPQSCRAGRSSSCRHVRSLAIQQTSLQASSSKQLWSASTVARQHHGSTAG